jgi:hypothetical protein
MNPKAVRNEINFQKNSIKTERNSHDLDLWLKFCKDSQSCSSNECIDYYDNLIVKIPFDI